MHDGISFEGRGLPAAVVVTDAFLHEARVQRAALGMDGLEPVVIQHPLSTLTEAQIEARAEAAAEAIEAAWLGT
jgi:hypothetical protein